MKPIIIKNLNKYYGNKKVFKNFNCIFSNNEFNCITGSSGIGKTTLLNILMGLDKDYEGDIIGIKDKKISVVFQDNRLLNNYSIIDNINFILDEKLNAEELSCYLKELDLEGLENKKVKHLSGGMKRRVSILRGSIKDADLYLFDEPFKDMDKKTHERTLKFVKKNLNGKTIIFSSHNKKDLEFLNANRVKIE